MRKETLAEAKKCVKCGKCRATCPVFQATQEEGKVARGRIALIAAVLEGNLAPGNEYGETINSCLRCFRCEAVCPAGVNYKLIVREAASTIKPSRISAIIFRHVLPKKRVFNTLIKILRWWQKLLPRSKTNPKLRHLSLLAEGGSNIPELAKKPALTAFPEITAARSQKHTKVAIFTGCLNNYVYPEVVRAAIDVLSKAGAEVILPKKQICCGAAVMMRGDTTSARKIAKLNREIFDSWKVDGIITLCATCGWFLKSEYPPLIGNAGQDLPKIYDIAEYLDGVIKYLPKKVQVQVGYHDPCHLRYGQGIADEPRRLLDAAGNFTELEGAEICCGGNVPCMLDRSLADLISRRKSDVIRKTESEIIATGCPGCMAQLRDKMASEKINKKVVHLIEFLAGQPE